MMARDIARALDPVLIASDCGISLDDWQADLMRSTAPRVLLWHFHETVALTRPCCARARGGQLGPWRRSPRPPFRFHNE